MMKAIKINKPGEIYVSEIPDAKWKKGYAVIEVKALGVCGSDVHAYAGKSPNVSYPLVIGHETAGIVVGRSGSLSLLRNLLSLFPGKNQLL